MTLVSRFGFQSSVLFALKKSVDFWLWTFYKIRMCALVLKNGIEVSVITIVSKFFSKMAMAMSVVIPFKNAAVCDSGGEHSFSQIYPLRRLFIKFHSLLNTARGGGRT